MADKVLADVNVCLDLLLDRQPFVDDAGQIFQMAEKEEIQLAISGLSFDTLFYIMRPEMGAAKSTALLQELIKHVQIAEVNEKVVKNALYSGWKDLEDALHYYCAIHAGCKVLITRNKEDFSRHDNSILILSPEEFLEVKGKL